MRCYLALSIGSGPRPPASEFSIDLATRPNRSYFDDLFLFINEQEKPPVPDAHGERLPLT
jgi:hypothetical protein